MNMNLKLYSLRYIAHPQGATDQKFSLLLLPAGGLGNALSLEEIISLFLTNPCSIAACHI